MIFFRVDVWWEGTVGPAHQYERWVAFQSEHAQDEYDLPPEDFGIEDPDNCAWDITSYRVKFEDIPEEIRAWVPLHPCPNGIIPEGPRHERRSVPLWVKAAFLEVVKHQHTNLMMDREPDDDGDAPYWEIDNRVLREFAASIGVGIFE